MRQVHLLIALSLFLGGCGVSGFYDFGPIADDDHTGQLVRIRVQDFDGSEPPVLSSDTHPRLFELHESVARVDLAVVSFDRIVKTDDTPSAWRPHLRPSGDVASRAYIELRLFPRTGRSVHFREVVYTLSAQVDGRPSAIELRSSADRFATAIRTTPLRGYELVNAQVSSGPTSAPLIVRFEPSNAHGYNGPGAAGFALRDVIVKR